MWVLVSRYWAEVPVPAHEHILGEVADGAMRAVGFAVVDPAGEHDPGLGEAVELHGVGELASSPGVERLGEAVLPRRVRVDVDCLDAAQGEAVADGPGDELRAVVGVGVPRGRRLRCWSGWDCRSGPGR